MSGQADLTHERLVRRAQRDRNARREAERLLEEKSRELWNVNQELAEAGRRLERRVEERTQELQEANQQLSESNSALEQVNVDLRCAMDAAQVAEQTKARFLANMSHEIRTPMHAILGLASLLRDEPLSRDGLECVGVLNDAANTLMRVLDDLLDYSRLESGTFELSEAPFQPRAILTSLHRIFMPKAQSQGAQFLLRCDERIPTWVNGDATRLRQVLSNLLSNAFTFAKEGKVTLSLTLGEGDHIVWSVEDNGKGMSQETLKVAFTPFEQADRSNSRAHSGTGLGLPITERIVTVMGGQLLVHSRVGIGSHFECILPMPQVPPPPAGALSDLKLRDSQVRVLVVDDQKINLLVAKRLLSKLGAEAVVVESGRQALEVAAETRFDLILLDIHMPEMDGPTTARGLRATQGPNQFTPIVAVTADIFARDSEDCRNSPIEQFLHKPLDQKTLAGALIQWAQHQRELVT